MQSEHHDYHMTLFPSMKPAGRHEAMSLRVSDGYYTEKKGMELTYKNINFSEQAYVIRSKGLYKLYLVAFKSRDCRTCGGEGGG